MRILTFFVLIFAFRPARSQIEIPTACEKAPSEVQEHLKSAIKNFRANMPAESINNLERALAIAQTQKISDLCRACIFQWLAINYDDLDSLEETRKYVTESLKEDPEIWRDHASPELTSRLRATYQKRWEEILTVFSNKRKSWRVAAGPIIRAELSYRYGLVTGIGTTAVLSIDGTAESFNDLLLYVRLQRMRKNIQRLTAGYYAEFSFLFPLKGEKWKNPDKAVSFGPLLGYAYQSGWEWGVGFEIARLVIGDSETKISQTFSEGNLAFSYANFELYIRKWF